MTEFDKMRACGLYLYPTEQEFVQAREQRQELLYDYNLTRPREFDKRKNLLKQMLAEVGEDCTLEPPLYMNLGGMFVHLGKGVYANFGLTLVDDAPIYIGDGTLFGPNVTLTTAGHPVEPKARKEGYIYCEPIRIGSNCWIGSDVTILPGVTIGNDVVIGAHSTVTRDIPDGVVAYGSPCKVVRNVQPRDFAYYFRDRAFPEDVLEALRREK